MLGGWDAWKPGGCHQLIGDRSYGQDAGKIEAAQLIAINLGRLSAYSFHLQPLTLQPSI